MDVFKILVSNILAQNLLAILLTAQDISQNPYQQHQQDSALYDSAPLTD